LTGISVSGKKVLILGSGGASATCASVLQEENANAIIISRSGENHYGNLHLHKDASLIVNATPVGMYPQNGKTPIDLAQFPQLEGVIDLIYNPARTQLLLDSEARGIKAVNGLWMLVAQAKESAQWFTGREISDGVISVIYRQLKLQMENIILIGMPGCGKSTIGKALATVTGKTFMDADLCIEKVAGMTIPQIFASEGEEDFRRRETQVLSQLGMQSGQVIATGGGCVTRPENYQHLHRNGTVICIHRQLDQLATEGRPLSQSGKLEEMYRLRKPLYHRFADHCVENSSSVEAAVSQILSALEV
jgi:shikimate dehydrogenase